jgi:hypothetical protein
MIPGKKHILNKIKSNKNYSMLILTNLNKISSLIFVKNSLHLKKSITAFDLVLNGGYYYPG